MEDIAADLRRLLAGDVEFDDVSRALYATDAGLNQIRPLGVVAPRDTEDVVRLVEYAGSRGLTLVPRGMGSGLAGGAVGPGIQVDFTRYMNRILEIADDATWVRVQPGVVMGSLNRELRARGVFFAPDPSSENYCSLGGMIGTNSSGARTVAYGGTKDHVLAVETVLADGSLFRAEALPADSPALSALLAGDSLGARAFAHVLRRLETQSALIAARMPNVVKNCSGYRVEAIVADGATHLQRLFVGAEGTLGLVTEATLNLVPLPARRGIAMAYFPSVFASGEAVPGILGLGPTAVEIMDSRFLAVVRKNDARVDAMLPPQTDTALLIEFEGRDEAELEDRFAALSRHLAQTGVLQVVRPRDAEETERLWTVRKSAVALALRLPGPRRALPFIEDVTVHPTEVAGYVNFLQGLFEAEGVDAFMYGHVGDGNIHTRPLLDPKDPDDLRTMERLYESVSEYVLGVKGTMSGEHGDGLLRTPHISRMYGCELYELFVEIKEAFDPQGLLNPGKKVGPQDDTGSLQSLPALRRRLSDSAPADHAALPGGRLREGDREVPRLRAVQGSGDGHHVPDVPSHAPGAGLAPGQGQHAAPHNHRGTRPRRHLRVARAEDRQRLLHRLRDVRRRMPLQREHPQADAGGQEQIPLAAPRRCGRGHPVPRGGRVQDGQLARPPDEPSHGEPGPSPPRGASDGHRSPPADGPVHALQWPDGAGRPHSPGRAAGRAAKAGSLSRPRGSAGAKRRRTWRA